MSNFIKTRNSRQCRSHHQKMIKVHGSIPSIVSYLESFEKKISPKRSSESIKDSNEAPAPQNEREGSSRRFHESE